MVGKDIARKCGGVALAAKVLGHMLRTFTFDEWESVSKSNIWNVSTSEDTHHVLSSLRLTYSYMPSHLRLCFAYCATFPKGQEMVKDDLIHQWISLGFIDTTHVLNTRQLGEKYITQLLGLSFLEHSAIGLHHDDVTVAHLTMHDLVHDLARLVLADELVLRVSKLDNVNTEGSNKLGNINSDGSSCRYAVLDDCSKKLELYTDSPVKIRALRFLECGKVGLHSNAFSCAKYLRVLDLSHCFIQKLPKSVGQLKQLRYLNAPKIQHWMIPNSITKLLRLIYLSLRGSSALLKLPDSIGDLKGLIYLDLSGCSGLKELPKSFGKLKKLVHLDLSNCSDVVGDSEFLQSLTNLEYLNLHGSSALLKLPDSIGDLKGLIYLDLSGCSGLEELPKSFCKLKKLVHLDLSNCSNVSGDSEFLQSLTNLEYLNLTCCLNTAMLPEHLGSLLKLKYLNLSCSGEICEPSSPSSFGSQGNYRCFKFKHSRQLVKGIPEALGSLTKLQYLNLSQCHCIDGTKMTAAMAGLTELRHLYLSRFLDTSRLDDSTVSTFLECIGNISNLEHLDLSDNSFLRRVPHCFGCLRKLRVLDLSNCQLLQFIPKRVLQIDGLQMLHMDGCTMMSHFSHEVSRANKSLITLPEFKVQADHGASSSNIALLQGINPVELNITGLEKVKSIEEVESIRLVGKERIKELGFEWSRGSMERAVEDNIVLGVLVPPSTIKSLDIRGYNSAMLPGWLMGIPAYNFPNLVKIYLEGLDNCISLPPLGQLPNLAELVLRAMQSIAKIDEDLCGGVVAFPRLTDFTLCDMQSLQVWNTMYSGYMFPSICTLMIRDCPKLRLKPCPPNVDKLIIRESDGLLSSWGESTSSDDGASTSSSPRVTTLKIEGCKVPMHEWRLIHHLPALRVLLIKDCSDLTCSPEIARALSPLECLSVLRCSLAPLPEWLGHLTSLEILELRNSKVEALRNSKHLTSLKELYLIDCDSMIALPQWVGDLASLFISRCHGLESLPESIQQSTKLKDLKIYGCPALRRWCETEENKRKLSHIKEVYIGN